MQQQISRGVLCQILYLTANTYYCFITKYSEPPRAKVVISLAMSVGFEDSQADVFTLITRVIICLCASFMPECQQIHCHLAMQWSFLVCLCCVIPDLINFQSKLLSVQRKEWSYIRCEFQWFQFSNGGNLLRNLLKCKVIQYSTASHKSMQNCPVWCNLSEKRQSRCGNPAL